MRIAHILPWPTVGGVERATLRVAQAVADDGYQSIAYCFEGPTQTSEMFTAAGLQTVPYRWQHFRKRNPVPFLLATLRLALDFRRRQIDIVHCADVLAAAHAAFAGRLAQLPVICHVRNRFDNMTPREKSYLRFVDRFAFVSLDTWRKFDYPVPPNRGQVVYDGLEAAPYRAATYRAATDRERSPIVGMVARVAPQKDYPALVRAASLIVPAFPSVRFLCVGDHDGAPEYREHYAHVRQLISTAGLDAHFTFTGHCSEVVALMSTMDVFVLSTRQEGLPLVILEAMALGLPVVATAIDGLPEVVDDGVTGLLYPLGDSERLAHCILALLHDRVRAAALGDAGRARLDSRFSQHAFAAGIMNLYRGVKASAPRADERSSVV